MTHNNSQSNDRTWECLFDLQGASDETLQEAIEYYAEALDVVTAVWEARCKRRARHKRFRALWTSLEQEDET